MKHIIINKKTDTFGGYNINKWRGSDVIKEQTKGPADRQYNQVPQ